MSSPQALNLLVDLFPLSVDLLSLCWILSVDSLCLSDFGWVPYISVSFCLGLDPLSVDSSSFCRVLVGFFFRSIHYLSVGFLLGSSFGRFIIFLSGSYWVPLSVDSLSLSLGFFQSLHLYRILVGFLFRFIF